MARDTLHAGEVLENGETMKSKDERFWLVMQPDGNLVLYVYGANHKRSAHWQSGSDSSNGDSYELLMHKNGYIHIVNSVWYAPLGHTSGGTDQSLALVGTPESRFVVQNDGNLVIYAPDGSPTWASDSVYEARDKALIAPNTLIVDVEHGGIDSVNDRLVVNSSNEHIAVRDGQLYVDLAPNEQIGIREPEQPVLVVSKLAVDQLGGLMSEEDDDDEDQPIPVDDGGVVSDNENGIVKRGIRIPHNEREIHVNNDVKGYFLT